MGSSDAHVWHIRDREPKSEWEALFIHSVIEWVRTRTGKRYKSILDAPCGNGRLHPYLRAFGYDVKGFDISEELVEEAKRKGRNCWVGDLRDPKAYRGEYDVVLNWFTSFGYFSHEENLRVMENFYRALKEKGVLLLDFPLFGKGFVVEDYIGIERRGEDLLEIMENRPDERTNHLRMRLFRDEGDRLTLVKELRVELIRYSPDELEEMMRSVGFREVYLFETMRTAPPGANTKRVTLVGVK